MEHDTVLAVLLNVLANISRSRYNTPAVWMKWNLLVADNVAHAAGASVLSLERACIVRAVGLANYRWALPRISSVAIVTQPVHRLQIRPIVHNQGTSQPLPQVTSGSMQ